MSEKEKMSIPKIPQQVNIRTDFTPDIVKGDNNLPTFLNPPPPPPDKTTTK